MWLNVLVLTEAVWLSRGSLAFPSRTESVVKETTSIKNGELLQNVMGTLLEPKLFKQFGSLEAFQNKFEIIQDPNFTGFQFS